MTKKRAPRAYAKLIDYSKPEDFRKLRSRQPRNESQFRQKQKEITEEEFMAEADALGKSLAETPPMPD